MPDGNKAVQVRITGRVQGVGFRDWTYKEASGLGLVGWVRNEGDGSVGALLVGPEKAVAAMLERLWTGPRFAAVSDVASQTAAITNVPADFRITR
jgi:acylphosphatase